MKRRPISLCYASMLVFAVTCLLGGAQSLAQNAYITNIDSNNVSVIDTATNTVIATIPNVGARPFGVAVPPNGSKVYVTNFGSPASPLNSVQVIDTATNTVAATITVGFNPFGVAVTPDGSEVYVTGNSSDVTGNVSVIATATNTVTPISISAVLTTGVAVSPDGSKAYVAGDECPPTFGDCLLVINTATNTVIASIPIGINSFGNSPSGVAVTPDGSKVYVGFVSNGNVSVIDTATNTVTANIATGAPFGALGVAVSPDGSKAYVSYDVGGVVVIATATDTVTAVININAGVAGVALTPDGSKLYVAGGQFGGNPNNVFVFDTATNALAATIPVGIGPIAFGIFIALPTPAPTFAGTPGFSNCRGVSVSALSIQFGGDLGAAAAALGFPSVQALQQAITAFCGG